MWLERPAPVRLRSVPLRPFFHLAILHSPASAGFARHHGISHRRPRPRVISKYNPQTPAQKMENRKRWMSADDPPTPSGKPTKGSAGVPPAPERRDFFTQPRGERRRPAGSIRHLAGCLERPPPTNQTRPLPKTTQNHPKPPKTTQNHPKPPEFPPPSPKRTRQTSARFSPRISPTATFPLTLRKRQILNKTQHRSPERARPTQQGEPRRPTGPIRQTHKGERRRPAGSIRHLAGCLERPPHAVRCAPYPIRPKTTRIPAVFTGTHPSNQCPIFPHISPTATLPPTLT